SRILYKNSYPHSPWLSLMHDRHNRSMRLLESANGVQVVAIDEKEQERLGLLLDDVFSRSLYDATCVSVVHNPGGIQGDNFSYTHEYAYFKFPRGGRKIGLQTRADKDADVRPLRDVSKGNHLRENAANCFYPILVRNGK